MEDKKALAEKKKVEAPVKKIDLKKEIEFLGSAGAAAKLKQAINIANLAQKIIAQKKLFCEINGQKYVYVKGWKLIANMAGLVPTIDVDATQIETVQDTFEKNGQQFSVRKFRVKAVAYLIDREGRKHGTAIGVCTNREKNKIGQEDTAILGMAQTRAIGRACKNALDWIVVLAGYADIPVEEIDEGFTPASKTVDAEALKVSDVKNNDEGGK